MRAGVSKSHTKCLQIYSVFRCVGNLIRLESITINREKISCIFGSFSVSKSKSRKIRHVVEALAAAFLFAFQHIPVLGPWYGLMLFPLTTYIFSMLWVYPEWFESEIQMLFFSRELIFGRIVAITGFAIFLIALIQFLKGRRRLLTTGLYSVVRHPQYFGITVMALGISMMCIQFAGARPEVLYVWPIQVLGYVLLASYEEQHFLREYEKEYQQYKQEVSFIFPVPRLTKIPEPIFAMVVALVVTFLLTLL